MRRLLLLACAIVFVDTTFFAAMTPLLPHFEDKYDLTKTGAGVLAAAYPAGTFLARSRSATSPRKARALSRCSACSS